MNRLLPVLALLASHFISSASAAPLEMSEVAKGVFVHEGKHLDFEQGYDGDIANIGFIIGERYVAVIDTGGSFQIGSALRESVRKVTQLPIRYVINTHIHPDHIFGNAAFEQDHPEFIGHAQLPSTLVMNQEALVNALIKELGKAAVGSKIIVPARIVADTLQLDLGERQLTLKAWPKAHTNTDLTVFDQRTKTVWMGDLLFITRTPSLDGDLKGWISVIDDLKQLDASITIPGHGHFTTDKNGMLDKEAAYLKAILNETRTAIKNGVDLLEAINIVGQSQRGDWELFDIVNPRNINLAYPQLEWE